MPIKSITTDFSGEVGVLPRLVRILTTDSFATITATNYLRSAEAMGYTFYPNDAFLIAYGTNADTTQQFTVNISSGNITLVPGTGEVTLPVTDGNFAVFSGTNGTLADLGYAPSDPDRSTVAMSLTPTVAGNIVQYQDTTGTIKEFDLQAGLVLSTSITLPDTNANMISFDVTVTAAALASGGSVTLFTSSGTKRYKIRNLYLNYSNTSFNGGGGDRGGVITDGTTQYATIPAATMQSLVNAAWGNTNIAMSASASLNISTAEGANIVFQYNGGTTDYTNGTLVISGVVQRIQ